ncbi:MAG: hypothetical protein ISP90_02870 [Nevskia sp.]|nr:hypothetical protein [Nevskia sp.]
MSADIFGRADRLAAITQSIGFTLWQIQELEGCAAQYIVLLTQATPGMGTEAGLALIDKALSKTFGHTIHQLAKAGLLSEELERRFMALLNERNWLVHKSRGENRDAIHGDAAAQRLLDRLGAMECESKALLNQIGSLAEKHVLGAGITRRRIDELTGLLLERWHTGADS